jgi:hypothetical protein
VAGGGGELAEQVLVAEGLDERLPLELAFAVVVPRVEVEIDGPIAVPGVDAVVPLLDAQRAVVVRVQGVEQPLAELVLRQLAVVVVVPVQEQAGLADATRNPPVVIRRSRRGPGSRRRRSRPGPSPPPKRT